jgi:hypothetical protein
MERARAAVERAREAKTARLTSGPIVAEGFEA